MVRELALSSDMNFKFNASVMLRVMSERALELLIGLGTSVYFYLIVIFRFGACMASYLNQSGTWLTPVWWLGGTYILSQRILRHT
jgi:hypothetical protein